MNKREGLGIGSVRFAADLYWFVVESQSTDRITCEISALRGDNAQLLKQGMRVAQLPLLQFNSHSPFRVRQHRWHGVCHCLVSAAANSDSELLRALMVICRGFVLEEGIGKPTTASALLNAGKLPGTPQARRTAWFAAIVTVRITKDSMTNRTELISIEATPGRRQHER